MSTDGGLSRSAAVMAATARYFGTHEYAPSESPTADREVAERAGPVVAGSETVRPGG